MSSLILIAFVDGHDLVPFFVVGGVQREGELELDLIVAELADHFGYAGGGDGDTAGAHGQSVG